MMMAHRSCLIAYNGTIRESGILGSMRVPFREEWNCIGTIPRTREPLCALRMVIVLASQIFALIENAYLEMIARIV